MRPDFRLQWPMKIDIDDLSRPDIHALLEEHLQSMHALDRPAHSRSMSCLVDPPPGSLPLRRARPADAAAVARCVMAAYAHWVSRLGRQPWPMLQDYREVVQTEHVVVADLGGEVVGVLVVSETDDGFLVDNVAVLPAHKGQGIGKALLVHAENEAKARGHRSLYLYTNEMMAENIALYERVGYVAYERRRENGFSRVFLRKTLA